MIIIVLILAFIYFFGTSRKSIDDSKAEIDSALIEEAEIQIDANKKVFPSELKNDPKIKGVKTKKINSTSSKNIPVARDFLNDTVRRH